jgi:hypothetical protein
LATSFLALKVHDALLLSKDTRKGRGPFAPTLPDSTTLTL